MAGDLVLDPQRFVLRSELGLLYDREWGLEHQLNETATRLAAMLVGGIDAADVQKLANEFAISLGQVYADMRVLHERFTVVNADRHPSRKSGAPAAWFDVDVRFPLALELELTKVCNWHCDFCYNVWKVSDDHGQRSRSTGGGSLSAGHLPLPTISGILSEAAQQGCLRVRLSGGEPTLHPDFEEIVALCGAYGFDTELFTNGVRLNGDRTRHLVENGVRILLVSIHGAPATHNRLARNKRAYHQALNAIEVGVAAGLDVVAESLVCDENVDEVPALAAMLSDLGVRGLSLMPYVPSGPSDVRQGLAPSSLPSLIEACHTATGHSLSIRVPCAPKHCLSDDPTPVDDPVMWEFDDHCAAGILWASISWDGQLRHCPHSDAYAGPVTDGIGSVWRDHIVPAAREALEPSTTCAPCSQVTACRGGCHLGKVRYSQVSSSVPVALTSKRGTTRVAI